MEYVAVEVNVRVFQNRNESPKVSEGKKGQAKPRKSDVKSVGEEEVGNSDSRMKKLDPPKKEFSDREIREKLGKHVELSKSAKTMGQTKKPELLGNGFMNEEVVAAKVNEVKAQKATEVQPQDKTTIGVSAIDKPSDVGLNDPKDPLTTSKLKSVLDMGAFNFNPKERDILSKILEDRN